MKKRHKATLKTEGKELASFKRALKQAIKIERGTKAGVPFNKLWD
jgi:hypothetical protein